MDWGLLLPNISSSEREEPSFSKMDPFLRKSSWLDYSKEIIPASTIYAHVVVSIDSTNAVKYASTLNLVTLREYVHSYYKMMDKTFSKVEYVVLTAIKPSGNNQAFSKLWNAKTIEKYAHYVADFVYLLCVSTIDDYPHSALCKALVGTHVHEMFHEHVASIIHYVGNTNMQIPDFEFCYGSIHSLLLCMFTYNPDDMSVMKSCQDPVLRYHLLKSLQKGLQSTDYGFRSVNTVTSPLSMLLFCCRGVILMEVAKELWSPSESRLSYTIVMDTWLPFCTDMRLITTFSRLKKLKALASTMAYVTPAIPPITNVSEDREEFTTKSTRFSITMLRSFVKGLTTKIESQLNTVLMGYDDSWVRNIVQSQHEILDDWNNTDDGYWFGNDPENAILHGKRTLLDHVIASTTLNREFVHVNNDDVTRIQWNADRLTTWVCAAHRLLTLLTILLHVTSSCGPPRAEEYSNFSFANTGYIRIPVHVHIV